MNIAVIYNQKNGGILSQEYDDPIVPLSIVEVLRSNGHDARAVRAICDLEKELEGTDFVFNIAEGFETPARESQVPALLERLDIPYTGSGPYTLELTLSKFFSKVVLAAHGIAVPQHRLIVNPDSIYPCGFKYPSILKPDQMGSSIGVSNSSIVHDFGELKDKADELFRRYRQPVVVEEYLPGEEYTVPMIDGKVLPLVWINFENRPEGFYPIDGRELKWELDSPDRIVCPAPVDARLEQEIQHLVLQACRYLGVVDVARADIRLDGDGVPRLIEINGLPGLHPPDPSTETYDESRLVVSARAAGMDYNDIVMGILGSALRRYNME